MRIARFTAGDDVRYGIVDDDGDLSAANGTADSHGNGEPGGGGAPGLGGSPDENRSPA